MTQLQRNLSSRHISMIALGGSLGTGIFLTSGAALYQAGPAGALLAYGIMGIMVYFLLTSLGEMAAYRPISGSFCQYANDYVGPSFGFAMGYNYWFNWAITIAVELIAASIVMQYWFPHANPIYFSALFFIVILAINLLPVKGYGESEFWLSCIKVGAIVFFIVLGIFLIAHHPAASTHYWHLSDGPFHGGLATMFSVFILSGFSFQGTELVGIAAGEAKDPQQSLPRAIKNVFWRILLFYVGTLLIISLLIPFTDPRLLNSQESVALSPFTLIMHQAQFFHGASVLNAIILLALLSACNSDLYSATRILFHLSQAKQAPSIFSRLNRFHIPIWALLATASFGILAVLLQQFGSNGVFLWLVNISSLAGFIAWFGIALSHYRFRAHYLQSGNALENLPFKAPWYPIAPLIALSLTSIVILGQAYVLYMQHQLNAMMLLSNYIGLIIVLMLYVGHRYRIRKTTQVLA